LAGEFASLGLADQVWKLLVFRNGQPCVSRRTVTGLHRCERHGRRITELKIGDPTCPPTTGASLTNQSGIGLVVALIGLAAVMIARRRQAVQ
jgi:LPXTG-motif cell wall-anchored protein